ncbi:helix-turn-helix domain-containing protein (plasmid) [Deinococcus taeanensis]|uniref:substrate-binding domain-containing protein n=1 Tax=Deinococcus taeanensis TaxID=2737050 RepID=UPI001CDC9AEC|nr:substrate-binding domain-containing protein [Deinococcus taeanensis]UBV44858.1 helix-turn-helix domain-containing protein [Deinococcus taeanensis]
MTRSPERPGLHCHLRERREAAGHTAAALARAVGISRQALHRIEQGSAVPGTLLALQLSAILNCRVEDLFELRGALVSAQASGPLPAGTRVRLAQVDDTLRALPLRGTQGLHAPADGVVRGARGPALDVQLLTALDRAAQTAVIAGCDPALGLLCSRVGGDVRAAWQPGASLDALRAAARGEAHAAGLHLNDPRGAPSHAQVVAAELPGAALFTLWQTDQGLLVAPGNPHGVLGAADLARPELRLVTRAPGAGGRVLLEAWLAQAGLDVPARAARHAAATPAATPLDAADLVAQGRADVAPGPRSAARACSLDFLPLHTEQFDLAVPQRHLAHPGVQAVLAAAKTESFQQDLRSLGGYDPAGAGTRVEVHA